MKHILLLMMLFEVSLMGKTQSMSGKVVDKDSHEAIIGAVVYVGSYEFYDESSNPRYTDDDNAGVPNLDKWYCSSLTYFSLHNRGFKTYAIARMHGDKEKYLKENTYDASYVMEAKGNAYQMTAKNCIKVPNSWILDAVNLSIASMWQWNLVSANLDAGWAHCGQVDKDENRYGKSVIRKKDADGKWVDTNNSTNDFESDATASFLKK